MSPHEADQNFTIRPAGEKDIPAILAFIRELAEYEKLDVVATEEGLRRELFGKNHAADVILACREDAPVGFAVFYTTFSTLLGKRGLHLDDLYVKPEWRGQGIGKALLSHLAALAVEQGCGRFEWWCLDWNTDALEFYDKLGAKIVEDVVVLRLTGSALEAAATAGGVFSTGTTAS